MHLIRRDTFLWLYLQPEIRELVNDGEILVQAIEKDGLIGKMTDFSFLVFPFSKAYEGFLKKLFLDIKLIQYDDYYGDEIRIGRLLNPNYKHEKKNVFAKMCSHISDGVKISEKLWDVWKNGRNLTFHFFPHNFKRLNYDAAKALIVDIIDAMEMGVKGCGLDGNKG